MDLHASETSAAVLGVSSTTPATPPVSSLSPSPSLVLSAGLVAAAHGDMASLVEMRDLARVIAVIGCTGSGKSALALELCASLDGELVNADSMQLYAVCLPARLSCSHLGGPHEPLGSTNRNEPPKRRGGSPSAPSLGSGARSSS